MQGCAYDDSKVPKPLNKAQFKITYCLRRDHLMPKKRMLLAILVLAVFALLSTRRYERTFVEEWSVMFSTNHKSRLLEFASRRVAMITPSAGVIAAIVIQIHWGELRFPDAR